MDASTVEITEEQVRPPIRATAARVAALRGQAELLKAKKRLLWAEIENSPLYQDLKRIAAKLEGLEPELTQAEDLLRVELVDLFEQTGDKRHPYGEVKIHTVLEYRPDEAKAWAIRGNMSGLLALDVRGFEKIARVTDLDFVSSHEEPRGYIKSDLSEFLQKE